MRPHITAQPAVILDVIIPRAQRGALERWQEELATAGCTLTVLHVGPSGSVMDPEDPMLRYTYKVTFNGTATLDTLPMAERLRELCGQER